MNEMNTRKKIILISSLAVIFFAGGIFFNKLYQTPLKSQKIYKEALADYKSGDFSNSYYLFSRISALSDLKPAALYRQAEAAKAIDDKESAVKKYQLLFNTYPKNPLSIRAKYLAAQILSDENPKLAKRYFEQIMQDAPNTDYAIASEYYCGLILKNEYTKNSNTIFPLSKKHDVEEYFRHYLKRAPEGRLAVSVINNWLELDKNISSDDYLLMANSLYKFGEYPRVKELLEKTSDVESWVLHAKNLNVMGHKSEALEVLEQGLLQNTAYVSEDDVIDAINLYFSLSSTPNLELAKTLGPKVSGKGHDYIASLRCKYSSGYDKTQCYKELYLAYPNGKYAPKALSEIFMSAVNSNDNESAKKIGQDYLNKFRDKEDAPMVMFWLGKLAEATRDYSEYMSIYKSVITNYPDNYYAYRAYLCLNHQTSPIITDFITPQPVVYPYPNPNKTLKKLVELEDYEIVDEISGDDDFIKSWVLYQQGDFSHSMLIARNAMEELERKPDKYDLRWRLVYPVHYYEDIKKYADETGNCPPLMLSITREESYFNPHASSYVGAKGLMQLMPATAAEIASKKSLGYYDLSNSASNIKLGNYYYAYIKSLLSGMDVSAIASYNGGIGSVTRWKKSLSYTDTDSFVEQIPYEETQNYVKKVLRSYWNYIRIYNGNG